MLPIDNIKVIQKPYYVVLLTDIKVILDFVPNQSSNEHPWFVKSRDGNAEYYNHYLWADSGNNWVSSYHVVQHYIIVKNVHNFLNYKEIEYQFLQ